MLLANIGLRARLAEAETSIVELTSRLKDLEDLRGLIQTQLDDIVYPVLTLPPEIVSNIFLQCLPPPPVLSARHGKIGPNPTLAPLLLLQICRVWRQMALSTPHLWDSLHLRLEFLGPETQKVIVDWLGRAGSCPLTLTLCLHVSISARAISAILGPLAPRLQTLYLELNRPQFQELTDIGPFPILEHLAISYAFYEPGPPLKLFSATPRLHHVFFISYAGPHRFIVPRGSGVTKVICDMLSTNDCLDILRAGPFLKEISCHLYQDTSEPRTKVITHTHLKTLRLSGDITPLLRLLQLPALQNLHLSSDLQSDEGHGNHLPIPRDVLPSFLASTCLQRFHAGRTISSLAVEWFTTTISGLVDLELYNPEQSFLREFVTRLDRTCDSGFLPHLRILAFRECIFELDGVTLQALLSRCIADENTAILESFRQIWPAAPRFRFEYSPPHMDAMIAACRELVKRGMSIHVGPVEQNLVCPDN
ncbi:hypothetical protein C8F04DRAFT_522805 [Mycena alexandri]|uniref:F-box domain-containing protein n=1 Tax=Mycena alexandri TaxID=1745969 RepID=A0AAD6TEG7_9AGAR|nr:hypothetical protein C8F04DRAFT_522805 [Mycena alexandri]